jgi:hypothetical protein
MQIYKVRFEQVGFTTSPLISDACASKETIEAFKAAATELKRFPTYVRNVSSVYSSPDDDGESEQAGREIKYFVSIVLDVVAANKVIAEKLGVPNSFLDEVAELLLNGAQLDLGLDNESLWQACGLE